MSPVAQRAVGFPPLGLWDAEIITPKVGVNRPGPVRSLTTSV
ncbi:hypothetical protein [Mycobacterium lepromatosis]|nr:hypothetical protein [Mycobacterium lepromatosis]